MAMAAVTFGEVVTAPTIVTAALDALLLVCMLIVIRYQKELALPQRQFKGACCLL